MADLRVCQEASRLYMADLPVRPLVSRLYMADAFGESRLRRYMFTPESTFLRVRVPYMGEMSRVSPPNLPYIRQIR